MKHIKIFSTNTIGWITLIVGFGLNARLGIAVGFTLAALNWFRIGWQKKATIWFLIGVLFAVTLAIITHLWEIKIPNPIPVQYGVKIVFQGILILLTIAIIEKRVKLELASIDDSEIKVERYSLLATVGITVISVLIALGFVVGASLGVELIMAPKVSITSELISGGHQTVIGVINSWAEEPIAHRQLALCQLTGRNPLSPYDCRITNYTAETDQTGRFEIPAVDPGKYLIIYDTGMADFQESLTIWQGEEIKPGSRSWAHANRQQLYQDCGNNFYLIQPEGSLISWFYYHRTHYTFNQCGARFFLAHDIEAAISYEDDDGRKRLPNGVFVPTVVEVVNGYNSLVAFDVLYKQR